MRPLPSIAFVFAAAALLCGCFGADPARGQDDARLSGEVDAAHDADGADSTGDAAHDAPQDAPSDAPPSDADARGARPDATPLPPPPERPGPFELDCPRAEPTEQLRQWLTDNDHCYGEGQPLFEDVTLQAGVAHMHQFAPDLTFYKRVIGGGVVLEDLDNDGALDLYLTNASGPNRLFLNDGTGAFDDCTAQTGLGFEDDWTNGVSAADFDNDGWTDLYLANRGPDRLLRNNGDGSFDDVTERVGIQADQNSAGASWGDLDGDGALDLFVSTLAHDLVPGADDIERGDSFLFRNLGDGTFENISDQLGLNPGSCFIAPMIDLDNDGDLDIFLTQEFYEFARPQLFRNDGLDASGQIQFAELFDKSNMPTTHAVMGIGVLDVNRDGLVDLAASNLWGMWPFREVLLENRGELVFEDVAPDRGAWALNVNLPDERSNRLSSWAVITDDIDNDADDDLYLSYGEFSPGTDFHPDVSDYPPFLSGQRNALLLDDGDGQFAIENGSCSEDSGQSRAAVAGDIDDDGCLDLVVVNQNGAVRLLRNRCETGFERLSVELVGRASNRDAVGARVEVTTAGRVHHKRVHAGSDSVHSAAPRRLHFGLGEHERAELLEIWWPSGAHQRFHYVPAGRVVLEEPTDE